LAEAPVAPVRVVRAVPWSLPVVRAVPTRLVRLREVLAELLALLVARVAGRSQVVRAVPHRLLLEMEQTGQRQVVRVGQSRSRQATQEREELRRAELSR